MATVFNRFALVLALSSAVLSAPAFAEPADTTLVAVRTDDLDLASAKGARALDRRVHRAAVAACPEDGDARAMGTSAEARACQAKAYASAQAQVETALASAHSGNALAANSVKAPRF